MFLMFVLFLTTTDDIDDNHEIHYRNDNHQGNKNHTNHTHDHYHNHDKEIFPMYYLLAEIDKLQTFIYGKKPRDAKLDNGQLDWLEIEVI